SHHRVATSKDERRPRQVAGCSSQSVKKKNDEHQDTSNNQHSSSRQPQQQRPPSHAGGDERGDDDAVANLRQQMKALQARVEAVEEEKSNVIMQAQQYSSEVKKNYEETVAFYERKVASAQEEWTRGTQVQLDAQRRELSTEMLSLRDKCAALTLERQEAHQQEERLKAQLVLLTNEQNTTRHVPPTPSAANDEVSSAVISALEERVKALQHQLDNQLSTHQQLIEQTQRVESEKQQAVADAAEAIQRLNAALQLSAQQHANEVKQLRLQIATLESTLQEANTCHDDALRTHANTVATLQQALETARSAGATLAAAHYEPVLVASPVEDQLRADLVRLRQEHSQQIQQNMTQMQKDASELVALRKKLPETELHASELQTQNSELQRQRDAAHRNGEMLKTKMAAHQSSHASACAALQAQLNTLSAELEASRVKLHDAEAAAAAASTSLQVSHEAQQSQQAAAATQDRIRVLEKSIAERDQQHQQDMQGFQSKVDELRTQLSQKQAELDASARRLEGERTKQSYGEQTLTNLRSTIDALQEECDRLRSQRKQSHVDVCRIVAHVTPFLSSSGVAGSPASSSPQATSTFQPEAMSIEDIIAAVTRELTVQHEAVVEATRVHRQWEQTYQQAKDVNQKVSKQLTDAQKQLQEVRTELSTRDRTIASLQAKMKDDQGKWQDAQVNLSAQHTNTQRFETERAELKLEIQAAVDAKERAQQSIAMVNGELEVLRTTLQDREEELTTCQRSMSNLQMVLEQFQRSKQREVEEQTLYLQHELDTLRSQFSATETLKQKHREDLEAASRTHRKEIASKNVAISGPSGQSNEKWRSKHCTCSMNWILFAVSFQPQRLSNRSTARTSRRHHEHIGRKLRPKMLPSVVFPAVKATRSGGANTVPAA
ncbi:Hypothetical protein, putative, partial [Bodo saltans]